MTTVSVPAPAKVNLTLHITGRREDGYHTLESLVVFAGDVADTVSASPADTFCLSVTGPMSQGVPRDDGNLVLKAAKLMQRLRGLDRGAALTVEKNLPNGGGIGGGSADAAAAIKALAQLWGVDPLTGEEALALGADVPVCLRAPVPSFMSGIGETVEDAPPLPDFWLVLVNPGVTIPTGEVFARLGSHFSTRNPSMESMPAFRDFLGFDRWIAGTRNDLTPCMNDFRPEVLECIRTIQAAEACWKAGMSGSGSTCWGMFETERDAVKAAEGLSKDHPGWWVRKTAIAR